MNRWPRTYILIGIAIGASATCLGQNADNLSTSQTETRRTLDTHQDQNLQLIQAALQKRKELETKKADADRGVEIAQQALAAAQAALAIAEGVHQISVTHEMLTAGEVAALCATTLVMNPSACAAAEANHKAAQAKLAAAAARLTATQASLTAAQVGLGAAQGRQEEADQNLKSFDARGGDRLSEARDHEIARIEAGREGVDESEDEGALLSSSDGDFSSVRNTVPQPIVASNGSETPGSAVPATRTGILGAPGSTFVIANPNGKGIRPINDSSSTATAALASITPVSPVSPTCESGQESSVKASTDLSTALTAIVPEVERRSKSISPRIEGRFL